MGRSFRYWGDTEIVRISPGQKLKVACCSCGLTHSYTFTVAPNGDVLVDCQRDEKSTAQWRKRRGIKEVAPESVILVPKRRGSGK
jgi:hypothetical protein